MIHINFEYAQRPEPIIFALADFARVEDIYVTVDSAVEILDMSTMTPIFAIHGMKGIATRSITIESLVHRALTEEDKEKIRDSIETFYDFHRNL